MLCKLEIKTEYNYFQKSVVTNNTKVFLSLSSNSPIYGHVLHEVVKLTQSLLVTDWTFQRCCFHTQSWYYCLSPMNPFTCGMFQTAVSRACHNFPSMFCLPLLVWFMLLPSNLGFTYIFKNQSQVGEIKHVFVLFSYMLKGLVNCNIVFFNILHGIPTFVGHGYISIQ